MEGWGGREPHNDYKKPSLHPKRMVQEIRGPKRNCLPPRWVPDCDPHFQWQLVQG
ncbi:hypothetical protein Ahy_B09g096037 isoform C [Arachis hypogaea]|uniref:Uncharacterized protein n=1 Tax=Arachis hypogaea TaxID=3818 RepID=A0A444XIE4_ARAHY|nr:hypothetical protein Ahy_B09g096037 isoform C [Arachis hypogaea]